MNALIFGANGQDGHYLTRLLHAKNIGTITVSRHSGDVLGNVGNYSFVESQIRDLKPE